jgi:hypothetical protein
MCQVRKHVKRSHNEVSDRPVKSIVWIVDHVPNEEVCEKKPQWSIRSTRYKYSLDSYFLWIQPFDNCPVGRAVLTIELKTKFWENLCTIDLLFEWWKQIYRGICHGCESWWGLVYHAWCFINKSLKNLHMNIIFLPCNITRRDGQDRIAAVFHPFVVVWITSPTTILEEWIDVFV